MRLQLHEREEFMVTGTEKARSFDIPRPLSPNEVFRHSPITEINICSPKKKYKKLLDKMKSPSVLPPLGISNIHTPTPIILKANSPDELQVQKLKTYNPFPISMDVTLMDWEHVYLEFEKADLVFFSHASQLAVLRNSSNPFCKVVVLVFMFFNWIFAHFLCCFQLKGFTTFSE